MVLKRVIPCLLMKNRELYKSIKFKNYNYIGDPLNAIKLFNDKSADELIILDIEATAKNRPIDFDYLDQIAKEAFMPMAYGGGIKTIDDIQRIISIGFEKVVITSQALYNNSIISDAAKNVGNQSIVVGVDIKKNIWGKYKIYSHSEKKILNIDPLEYCKNCVELGAGEIFINNVNLDGTMQGYDFDIIQELSDNIKTPVIPCGGAGTYDDIKKMLEKPNINAVSAGSVFVYYGKEKSVLINYPDEDRIIR